MTTSPTKRAAPTPSELAQWCVDNPQNRVREAAQHFNISEGWLQMIVGSDCFKAALRAKQSEREEAEGRLGSVVELPLHERVVAVAHQLLNRVSLLADQSSDPQAILEAANDMLDRIPGCERVKAGGAGAGGGPAALVIVADKDSLQSARALMQTPQPVIEVKAQACEATPSG